MESWIQHYIKNIPETVEELKKLNADYLKAVEEAHKIVPVQLNNARDWARFTGARQELSKEKYLAFIKSLWQEKARAIAKQYVGNDETLNRLNPEIQRDVKPAKNYDHLQRKIDEKQDEMTDLINKAKLSGRDEGGLKGDDDPEPSPPAKRSVPASDLDKNQDKMSRITDVVKEDGQGSAAKKDEPKEDEREKKLREVQESLQDIFDRKHKDGLRMGH